MGDDLGDGPEPAASTAPAFAITPLADLPDDVELLKRRFREVEQQLGEKTQEAHALTEALESSTGTFDDGGAMGGFAPSVSDDLEGRVLELQHIADEKTAALLEREERSQGRVEDRR